jgi:hypothetical protein
MQSLTVYLLESGVGGVLDFDDAVDPAAGGVEVAGPAGFVGFDAKLFSVRAAPHPPGWLALLREGFPDATVPSSANMGALLVVRFKVGARVGSRTAGAGRELARACSVARTPGAMTSLFSSAGLRDVRDWDVPIHLVADSPEQYWLMLTELTAPVVAVLSQVDDAARQRIASKVIDAAKSFQSDGVVRLPGTARCVVGTK